MSEEKKELKLPKVKIRKTNSFVLNTGNTDILLDGQAIPGLKSFSLELVAPKEGGVSIAEVTLKIFADVEFEQAEAPKEEAAPEAPAAPAPAAPEGQ